MKKIHIVNVEIEVLADDQEQAEDYIDDILQKKFVYGVGLSLIAEQDNPPGEDVTRIHDWDFWNCTDEDDKS